jgi:outer membrane protein OmpA-like peptidoglycan-associated protein
MGAAKTTEPAKAQASPKSVSAQAAAASLTQSEPIGNAALARLLRTRVSAPRIQRACACGGHTASGECLECEENRLGLQTKLVVSEPGDRFEQEADRVAGEVMTMPARSAVTATSSRVGRLARESSTQSDAPSAGLTSAPPIVHEVLSSSGQPLGTTERAFMEPRFGQDFSGVRIHTGAKAAESAAAVQARAYTVGNDIVFGGRESASDLPVLAHELAHVVQQGGASPALQRLTYCADFLELARRPGVGETRVRDSLLDEAALFGTVEKEFVIPAASFGPWRDEPQIIDWVIRDPNNIQGDGRADIALLIGSTQEVVEVKEATWDGGLNAEKQLRNYLDKADFDLELVTELWRARGHAADTITRVEAMPMNRLNLDPRVVDGVLVELGWCDDGLIVFRPYEEEEPEEEEEPKDEDPEVKEPGPGESLPEQLGELVWPLAKGLAAAGLLDIGMALAGALGSFVSAPLVALAAVVLGIAFFWDELKWLASKIAGVAQFVWDKIAGLAGWVRGKLEWIVGKLHELGIKLAELGSWLAGKIAWLGEKLAEGLGWIAGKIASGAWWLGGKIASAAEAIWDWLWGSDVEPTYPIIDIPMTYEPTRHCRTVAYDDAIARLPADLLFAPDEFKLTPEAEGVLKEAAAQISAMLHKDDWIRFEGYADNTLSEEHNQRLSEQRAEAVASWFVEHGVVPRSRVRTEGYGESEAQGHDKETRKKDRRVEIWLPKRGGVKEVCW